MFRASFRGIFMTTTTSTANSTSTASTCIEMVQAARAACNVSLQVAISQVGDKVARLGLLRSATICALAQIVESNNATAATVAAGTAKNKVISSAITEAILLVRGKGFQSPGKGQTFARLDTVQKEEFYAGILPAMVAYDATMSGFGVTKPQTPEVKAARALRAAEKIEAEFSARAAQLGMVRTEVGDAEKLSQALDLVGRALRERALCIEEFKSLNALMTKFAPLIPDAVVTPQTPHKTKRSKSPTGDLLGA